MNRPPAPAGGHPPARRVCPPFLRPDHYAHVVDMIEEAGFLSPEELAYAADIPIRLAERTLDHYYLTNPDAAERERGRRWALVGA